MYAARKYANDSRKAPPPAPGQPKQFGDDWDLEANSTVLPVLETTPDGWTPRDTVEVNYGFGNAPDEVLSVYSFKRWAHNLYKEHGLKLGLAFTGGDHDIKEITAFVSD